MVTRTRLGCLLRGENGLSVWLTIPSARPAAEIADRIQRWQRQGYRIALWRNGPNVDDALPFLTNRDALKATPEYAGWGQSINGMIKEICAYDPQAQWFVGGGDDTDPDPTKTADDIAAECTEEFGGTLGVMQPTGDRWGEDEIWARHRFPHAPAYIDRICGSPWIGREYARRANRGAGPFWPEYHHFHADEELCVIAKRDGLMWQRRDLIHFHDHPLRTGDRSKLPEFLEYINSPEYWSESTALFVKRRNVGFPGSSLLLA
jgi:hypothetical protein